ncbi:hypothetical protein QIT30_gp20 [Saccharolobus solfataricus rod-shaped virus 1]|uniref:Uncharacterized protein n=1 Tax=Saccharolobus solfataricus rod-shaped virus 1 TaxID=2730619 RepID=A0A6M3VXN6_SSRV1|nr:hypothetical protein QIT30_gp20 [Saccharolobus solfataricus rod-shaped virus 1]QJF12296.1 hypothetical protein SSRV1_gp20 [Saccharolobus solfataricus rod-shaped virus 1]
MKRKEKINRCEMPKKKGSRSVAQMKYHLYNKIFNQNVYPAFKAMLSAGIESTLPTSLENVVVPAYMNVNYGIAFAQIIINFLNAINNFSASVLNNFIPNTAQSNIFNLATLSSTSALDALNSFTSLYDQYVENCSVLYQIAIFDETSFDASVYAPAPGVIFNNQACKKLESYFANPPTTVTVTTFENLGVGKTQIPAVDNYLYSLVEKTGVADALSKLAQQKNTTPQQYFNSLPDLAKYLLAFLSLINNIIDSGVALDVSWFDRSAFSERENDYQLLADNIKIQNFSHALGIILDLTPLDFNVLMPDFPTDQNLNDIQLSAILSTERAIISVFGQIFGQHLQELGPGATNISNSQYAETYISNYELYERIQKIVNKKYNNIWYAKMVASAILQVARYTYQGNLSYTAGPRTLPYDQFLQYWKQKWKLYGLSDADLQFAQQIGEQLQGLGRIQTQRKLDQKKVYLQNYKPIFYNKGFKNIANR